MFLQKKAEVRKNQRHAIISKQCMHASIYLLRVLTQQQEYNRYFLNFKLSLTPKPHKKHIHLYILNKQTLLFAN